MSKKKQSCIKRYFFCINLLLWKLRIKPTHMLFETSVFFYFLFIQSVVCDIIHSKMVIIIHTWIIQTCLCWWRKYKIYCKCTNAINEDKKNPRTKVGVCNYFGENLIAKTHIDLLYRTTYTFSLNVCTYIVFHSNCASFSTFTLTDDHSDFICRSVCFK